MIDQTPKRSSEPVWWSLFGAGGTWFAMLTPITILIVGILVPLGILNSYDSMGYERMATFATSFWGALFIIGTIALPIWHAMHRVHHGLHDLKFHTGEVGKIVCYGFAVFMTLAPIFLIFMM